MHELAARLANSSVGVDQELEREFEIRLVESSTLAFRVAYSVLRHREDAEDVAQEAFAKAFRSFRQLRDRERFRAWLIRMTWRLALDRQRAEGRRIVREMAHQPPAPMIPATDEAMVARERADRLWQAIDRLPDKLRIVVVLANIEEHDVGEVARLTGLPPGTVKSRLFLARQRLREQLQ
jgi:RNA polymerase sigma-70 factor (ECF subfamily)